MKLSTEDHEGLIQIYEKWWYSYLNGDVKTYDSFLDDDFHFVGSTNNEELLNRKNTTDFFKATADQLAGKAELRNTIRNIEILSNDLAMITDVADAYVLSYSDWVFYSRFRFTSLLKKKEIGWRFIYQHFSAPDSKADEGETLGTQKITKENQELKEAIKRRTVELEQKNRALQIETALERIRAQVTAMKESADLLDIVVTMRAEFVSLGHEAHYFWHMRWLTDRYEKAMTSGDGTRIGMVMTLPRHMHGDIKPVAEWEKGKEPTYILAMDVNVAVDYVEKMITLGNFERVDPQAPTLDDIRHIGGLTFVMARTTHGEIGYSLPGKQLHVPKEDLNTLVRFAGVFDLAYKRFEDLKAAELQHREVQIELALEKVRASAMAMHKSEELKEVVNVIFGQMALLNINAEHTGIVVDYEPKKDWHFWIAESQDIPAKVSVPYLDLVWDKQFTEAKKKGEDFFTTQLDFDEKNSFYKTLLPHIEGLTKKAEDFYFNCPGLAISTAIQKDIGLYIENFSGTPYSAEENQILERFASVFQQAYTRFLDLKKAEAQTREAKIEAALEKVRSRSLAMHNSSELADLSLELVKQVQTLGVETWFCAFNIYDEPNDSIEWGSNGKGTFAQYRTPKEGVFLRYYEAGKRGETLLINEIGESECAAHYEYLCSLPGVGEQLLKMKEVGIPFPNYQIDHVAFMKYGYLLFITYIPVPQSHDIFKRFSRVFEQTYTRFLDLKKAEEQARQAKIEVALERVRARALAMQEPEELKAVAEVLRKEMGELGVEELETSSIYIHDPRSAVSECWYAIKDIRKGKTKLVSDHFALNLLKTWVGRIMLEFFESDESRISIVMKGQNRLEWIRYCEENSKSLKGYYGEDIPDRTYHLYKFSHGAIGAASAGNISKESWILLERAANAFSLAYSRFKDLTKARLDLVRLKEAKLQAEKALSELKTTQAQLIHSEKMASLGELTAGIAHEIQNPLNFVNNFSEVSVELVDEMNEELENGDMDEARAIGKDLKENLSKINHHGKRADAIVKGMLEHSRANKGEKALTDLNVLTDEFVRLSYHGLRAKDKSFNADFRLDLDPDLPKVTVVPSDMGRVILNLVNNAFYAVDEKAKSTRDEENYKPEVVVSSKRTTKEIQLTVKDNGNGIPDHVIGKIFQPFYTTKPTGSGTGLGLSLSYDIIKVHNGELVVTSSPNQGASFLIKLPLS